MIFFRAPATRHCGIVLCLLVAFITIGCSEEEVAEKPSHVSLIAVQYSGFIYGHRGKMPKDEAEFKKYLAKREQNLINAAELESLDQLFISERDGQPIVMLYGGKAKKMDGEEVIAHEATGVDGRILVGTKSGVCELRSPKDLK